MSNRVLGVLTVLLLAGIGAGMWLLERTEVHRISIAAGPEGAEAYQVARAIATVTETYHPNIRIEVLETQGSESSIDLLHSGVVELATVMADTRMESGRMIAHLYPDVYQLLVREASPIESVADMRGRRVAVPPEGAGQHRAFWFLADHYGLSADDMVAVPMSSSAAGWALIDGAVDAVFRVRAAGNPKILGLINTVPTRLVPIRQGAAMQLRQPALDVGVIARGSYRGYPPVPPADLPTVAVRRILVGSESLDEGVAAAITRVLFERRRDLVNITPLAGFIAPPAVGGGTFIPLHPGARSFYDRNQPSFLQENAEPLALLVTVMAVMLSGMVQLRHRRKKRLIDEYNRAALRLGDGLAEVAASATIRARRQELFEIGARVVDDAESGLVSPDGFTFFTFTWGMVDDRLAHREEELDP